MKVVWFRIFSLILVAAALAAQFPHPSMHTGIFLLFFSGILLFFSTTGASGRKIEQSRILGRLRMLILSTGTVFFFLLFMVISTGVRSSHSQEWSRPEVMIVLGGGTFPPDQAAPSLTCRLEKAVEIYEQSPGRWKKIYLCGGLGRRNTLSEAEIMKRDLNAMGIPAELMETERRSTSTYENLKFLKANYPEVGQVQQGGLIISSRFHLFRVRIIARRAGLEHFSTAGAPVPLNQLIPSWVREAIALVKTVLVDR